MKDYKIIILLVFLFISSSYAQNFSLGLRLESNSALMNTLGKNSTRINAPTSYTAGLSYHAGQSIELELRAGMDVQALYLTGGELDLLLKYRLSERYYVFAGAVYHELPNERYYDNGFEYRAFNTDGVFPAFGLGYSFHRKFSLELTGIHLNHLRIGYSRESSPEWSTAPVFLNWIAKAGVCYTIDL